jgi:3'-phosphoadenosine 5'-phosphosulfate sulfotransferase
MIQKFKYDPAVDDIMERIEQIRAKFRQASSLVGNKAATKPESSVASQLSF